MTARPGTPYREHPDTGATPPPARGTLARDAVVVAVIVLAILSIAHWSAAIEAFATTVLGFPEAPLTNASPWGYRWAPPMRPLKRTAALLLGVWLRAHAAQAQDPPAGDPPDEDPAPSAPSSPAAPRRAFARSRLFTAADDRAERTRARALARQRRRPGEPEVLELAGVPDAYFFRAAQGGRRRVFVYLHARNADPRASCQQFAPVVTRFGWLLCPVGPGMGRDGARQWNNNPILARQYTTTAVRALFQRFPRRTRVTDNVLMGFSEGAFVAIQTGLNEPVMFPRWVIFAAHDRYLATEGDALAAARRSLRKLYLITGRNDEVVGHSRRAAEQLRRDRLGRVELRVLDGVGHQLPPAFVPTVRTALQWVTR